MNKIGIKLLIITLLLIINTTIKASSIEVLNWSELSNAINSSYDTIVISTESSFVANSTITISNKTVTIIPKNTNTTYIERAANFTEILFNITDGSNVTFGNDTGNIVIDGSLDNNVTTKQVFYVQTSSKLTMKKTSISYNNSTLDGSALSLKEGTVNI